MTSLLMHTVKLRVLTTQQPHRKKWIKQLRSRYMDKIIQETLSSIETDGDIIRGISTRRRNPPDMSSPTFYASLVHQFVPRVSTSSFCYSIIDTAE